MNQNQDGSLKSNTSLHASAYDVVKQRQHSEQVGERPKGHSTAVGLLRYLHDHVDYRAYSMPDAELEWLAQSHDQARMMAGNLGETLSQVAALVGYEIHNDGARSGGLQSTGIDDLLNHVSETVLIIESMAEIAGTANWVLRDRWEKRARALGFMHVDEKEHSNG